MNSLPVSSVSGSASLGSSSEEKVNANMLERVLNDKSPSRPSGSVFEPNLTPDSLSVSIQAPTETKERMSEARGARLSLKELDAQIPDDMINDDLPNEEDQKLISQFISVGNLSQGPLGAISSSHKGSQEIRIQG